MFAALVFGLWGEPEIRSRHPVFLIQFFAGALLVPVFHCLQLAASTAQVCVYVWVGVFVCVSVCVCVCVFAALVFALWGGAGDSLPPHRVPGSVLRGRALGPGVPLLAIGRIDCAGVCGCEGGEREMLVFNRS